MLKLIVRQANWGILGSAFAYAITFFVTAYVIGEVGKSDYGKYVTAHIFAIFSDTFLSLGIPFIILRFFPSLLKRDPEKASFIIYQILRYAFIISIVFMIIMYFISPLLDRYLYSKIENFSYLLFLISIHAPISIFMGIINSLYRSIFKIKEIMIYGTFLAVPLRAIITFTVFQYTNNIFYLVAIDIFIQLFTLFLMYYFFHTKEFKIFNNKKPFNKNMVIGNDIYSYGEKMYANSIISLLSTQGLPLLIGVLLLPEEMGIYKILMQIAALSMFLNKNLRNIFSPVIAKLYEESNIDELSILYKKTTFIVNIFTIPFSILVIFFSDEILNLFAFSPEDILQYKPFLVVLIIARMIYLLAGNSGAFMTMAGIEKKELMIQSIRGILVFLFSLIFIQEYALLAAIILFISSMIFVAIAQLLFIKIEIKISPFSWTLLALVLVSIPFIYFSIYQDIDIRLYHYIFIPVILYFIYFIMFYKKLKEIYLEIR